MCFDMRQLPQRSARRRHAASYGNVGRKRGELGEAQTIMTWVIPSQAHTHACAVYGKV